MKYSIAKITHTGKVRANNQDSLLAEECCQNGQQTALLVVADGMGGLAYGERASQLAVQTMAYWWKKVPKELPLQEVSASLDQAIYEAHRQIYYLSEELERKTGSTLSLLWLQDTSYVIKQIGDSRIYRINNSGIKQLTTDQTWCNQMIQNGGLAAEQAQRHRLRHALVNALGASTELEIATEFGEARRGESYLLCSDGFYQEAPLGQLPARLKRGEPQTVLQGMLEHILQGNAGDNASAVLCQLY